MPKNFKNTNNVTRLFYFSVGLAATLGLLVIYYWTLRANSSLGLLYAHNSLSYFILYIALTTGTSLLFGVSTVQFVYQWRHYGLSRIFRHGSGGVGALVGIIASSCPVCGSAVLSVAGIVGGLSSLPFQGLEMKALSFFMVGGSVLYSSSWLRRKGCSTKSCPPELDDSLRKTEYVAFAPVLFVILFLSFAGWNMFSTDIINSPKALQASYSCTINAPL